MATVYILHSSAIDRYYIGSCLDLELRLQEHINNKYVGFTSRAQDWVTYFTIDNLEYQQAREIETHIKNMKSTKYIINLKRYPEISQKLVLKYT